MSTEPTRHAPPTRTHSKTEKPKSSAKSISKVRAVHSNPSVKPANTAVKASSTKVTAVTSLLPKSTPVSRTHNETLRWEYILSDEDEEEKRIEMYKLNRRKRYLAASKINYNEWLAAA